MRKLIVWKCDSCGEMQDGVMSPAGDFVADIELERPPEVRAIGCTRCAYPFGRIIDEVDDLAAYQTAQDLEGEAEES